MADVGLVLMAISGGSLALVGLLLSLLVLEDVSDIPAEASFIASIFFAGLLLFFFGS